MSNQHLARIEPKQKQTAGAAHADFFSNLERFELLERMASMFAGSDMVPTQYRKNVSNCAIAIDLAERIGASPIAVMQNMTPVEGRPAWSSQFIIASINSTKKFSPLRFEMSEPGEEQEVEYVRYWADKAGGRGKEPVMGKVKIRNRQCYAWALEKATGQKLCGTTISIEMAVKEGWYTKNGSKWKTMEAQMLCYRAAAFFGRIYAPEVMMGMPTVEEIYDVYDAAPTASGVFEVGDIPGGSPGKGTVHDLNEKLRKRTATEGADQKSSVPEASPKSEAALAAASPAPKGEDTPKQPEGPKDGIITIEWVCDQLNQAPDADTAADVMNNNLKSLPKDQQQMAKEKFKETLVRLNKAQSEQSVESSGQGNLLDEDPF